VFILDISEITKDIVVTALEKGIIIFDSTKAKENSQTVNEYMASEISKFYKTVFDAVNNPID
jgi:hypothetical protein